jgi:predicted acylesterase/phospholipase RssA
MVAQAHGTQPQWRTLDRRFTDLAIGEAQGTRPMLLAAPMISETGEPLVIANGAFDAASADGCHPPLELRDLSPSGFRELRIARAVRANASFPRISPPLRISSETGNHLTDAGIVDNLGVGLAARFFSQDAVKFMVCRDGRQSRARSDTRVSHRPYRRQRDGRRYGPMPQAQRWAARTAQAHLLPSDIDNPVAPECTNSRKHSARRPANLSALETVSRPGEDGCVREPRRREHALVSDG